MGDVVDLIVNADIEAKRKGGYCPHSKVFAIEETRMLECRLCGSTIEPFNYIFRLACDQSNTVFTNKHLRNQKTQLEGDVKELKKERARLRAQVKRLNNTTNTRNE